MKGLPPLATWYSSLAVPLAKSTPSSDPSTPGDRRNEPFVQLSGGAGFNCINLDLSRANRERNASHVSNQTRVVGKTCKIHFLRRVVKTASHDPSLTCVLRSSKELVRFGAVVAHRP